MTKLELYAIGLLVLLAIVGGGYYKGHHDGVERTEEKFAEAALKQANESRDKEQAERDKLLTVSTDYEKQIAQIKVDAASRPIPVVRLCDATTTATVSTTTTAAGQSQSSATVESKGTAGRDIGGPIYDFADDFKACAVQVNSLLDGWPH